MKKQLLIASLLLGALFNANAQSVSFETSEGFTAGNINAQNGWESSSYGEGLYIENQVISSSLASDGTMSFKMDEEPEFGPQDGPVLGAYSPQLVVTGTQTQITFDINPSELGGADFVMDAISGTGEDAALTARIDFGYEGVVEVVDDLGDGLEYVDTPLEWTPATWYSVKLVFDFTAGTITYFVNDTQIYVGTTLGPVFNQIAFLNDGYGGFAYIDKVNVGLPLGIEDHLATQFSVFPNPSSDIVNLTNSANVLMNSVNITDINGRTVKSMNLNGVSNAQINISDLASGMYMMNISSDQGTATKKIIKS
jgi:hypothetical protein